MKTLFFLILCMMMAASIATAQQLLDKYQWKNRLVLIFAPSPKNTTYEKQVVEFKNHKSGFEDRDLKVFNLFSHGNAFVGDDRLTEANVKQLQQHYDVDANEFNVFLIGKDGGIKLQQTTPFTVKKLFKTIDAMPMRQREMKKRY